jgi:hypothetical protein
MVRLRPHYIDRGHPTSGEEEGKKRADLGNSNSKFHVDSGFRDYLWAFLVVVWYTSGMRKAGRVDEVVR